MNRCRFPLIIVVPGDPVAPGDFDSPVIREREISLWRSEGGDLGGGAGGVWRRGRARGRERRSGALEEIPEGDFPLTIIAPK